jgi:dihydrofolate synthase / folylpolyglutamate synthase
MKVVALQTEIVQPGEDILVFLRKSIRSLEEKSILVITSKIISFAQNRFVEVGDNLDKDQAKKEKHELAKQEADLYLEPSLSKYGVMLTIKNSLLAVNAGIDESNSMGKYILWPENLQQVTNNIWNFLRTSYGVKDLGIIVTDSKTALLRRGVTGTAVSYCGFNPLIDKIGEKDIFGKTLAVTQVNVVEAIATSGVFEMGESNEKRPLAVVSDFQQEIEFQDRLPTESELQEMKVDLSDDMYAPAMTAAPWKKGESGFKGGSQ